MTSDVWTYLVAIVLWILASNPIWGFNYEKIREIGRKSYILRVLAVMAVATALAFLEEASEPGLAIVTYLAGIPIVWFLIYSTVQRTKDAGVSKHWTWTVFLPLVSIAPLIVFMVLPTKAKEAA